MSDNPQVGSAPISTLPGLRVVRLAGRDAIAFAQAQFMNDVDRLGDLHWQWSGWLDPKGRVRALFALLRLDAQTLLLITPAAAASLDDELRRFLFRSKVRIDSPGGSVRGAMSLPEVARGAVAAVAGGRLELDFSGDAGPRALAVDIDDVDAPAAEHPADASEWSALDVAHGYPGLPGIALDAWTPQQLSLERLGAFSVRKGCYPGQEIVARTHFLGRAKRGLARLAGHALATGATLADREGRAVGQVVAAVGGEALAVVPLDPPDLALFADGVHVERRSLAGGLQR